MADKDLRILITGVGGDLGQALVKSARMMTPAPFIVGCDCDETGIGSAFTDAFQTVPKADPVESYLDALDEVCKSFRIRVVVPGSEPEIYATGAGLPDRALPSGAEVIVQPNDWLRKYGDKLTAMKSLEGRVELARYADGEDEEACRRLVDECGFPVVVKCRVASGGRGFLPADSEKALKDGLAGLEGPLVQEYLEGDDQEYSVGVWFGKGFRDVVGFRRTLGPKGASWYAENSDIPPDVLDYAYRTAEAAGLEGACNVQVRKTPKGVRLLEINPRFSSLVAARAACGFRDLEWSIREALGEVAMRPESGYRTIRFQRFLHEVVDYGVGWVSPSAWTIKRDS